RPPRPARSPPAPRGRGGPAKSGISVPLSTNGNQTMYPTNPAPGIVISADSSLPGLGRRITDEDSRRTRDASAALNVAERREKLKQEEWRREQVGEPAAAAL